MRLRRLVPLLLLAAMLSPGQGEDIYQRVKQQLGDDGVLDLRAKNYSRLAERLAAAKPVTKNERAELLALSAALHFLEGNMARAVVNFRASAQIRALKESDDFTLAMTLVKLGDETEARSVLSKLALQHTTNPLYSYWLGRLDYDERRYPEAVENLDKAVRLDPNSARTWDSLGLAWDMQGRFEQAREKFETAVSLNRKQTQPSPWPPHNLGYLLLRLGQTAQAETALRESLQYDPKLARTHYYLARTLEKEDRANEAVAEYRIAVVEDTTSAESCYSLAMLYRKQHREDEANLMFAEFKRRKNAESQGNH